MAQFIKDRYGLLIDGQWVDAQNGETFVTTNPASGEQLAICANASPEDVDRAVRAPAKRSRHGLQSHLPNVRRFC